CAIEGWLLGYFDVW
nr:immunoglobulin heavy chain junction region [Mus musculus]